MEISMFCNAGMSTSLIAARMNDYFKSNDEDLHIEAYDYGSLINVVDDTDLIILAPQVSWALDEVHKDYPDKKVLTLTASEFGSMNGEVIGKRVEQFTNLGE